MSSPQARRRQRSTRLTVAVVLIVLAALAVAGAVLSRSWSLTTSAAVLGVVLGAAATRITHSELMQARRDAARDRAAQASAYEALTTARSAEHAEFTRTMQARLDGQATALGELEVALGSAQKRAADATRRLNAEARRAELAEREGRDVATRLEEAERHASEAALRVSELEVKIDALQAELSAWEAMPEVRRHA
jgi:chromosome segregation ATPase